jgi:hypothetical protein
LVTARLHRRGRQWFAVRQDRYFGRGIEIAASTSSRMPVRQCGGVWPAAEAG